MFEGPLGRRQLRKIFLDEGDFQLCEPAVAVDVDEVFFLIPRASIASHLDKDHAIFFSTGVHTLHQAPMFCLLGGGLENLNSSTGARGASLA